MNGYFVVSLREHVSPREHACVSSRGAQSTELVSLYIGYWTFKHNYYYYYYYYYIIIYADDITLLGPTCSSILSMLSVCDIYARNMDILFNPAKTNCIFFPAYPTSLPGLPLHFMNTDIVFVPSCTFLGISVSSHDISDRNIPQSVQKLYRRSNEVMSDFKSLSRNVKSQLFSTFCLDAYCSQLWHF